MGARSGVRRLGVERQPHIRNKADRERRESRDDQPYTVSKQNPRPDYQRRAGRVPSTQRPQSSIGNQHANAGKVGRLEILQDGRLRRSGIVKPRSADA